MGEATNTSHRVTQGKNPSASIFSFYVSDMPEYIKKNVDVNDEFMRKFNVLQLADDYVILAEDEAAFQLKALSLPSYSEEKNLVINKKKTKYLCS